MQEILQVPCDYKDQPYHRRFQAIVKAIPAGSRVLDIACGSGTLMVELERKGCKCVGIEQYPGFVALARSKGLTVIEGDMDAFDTDPNLRDLIVQEYDAVVFSKCLIYLARKNELIHALRTGNIFINQFNPDHWKNRLRRWLGPKSVERSPYRRLDGVEVEINSRLALQSWGESYGYLSRVLLGNIFRSHDAVVHFQRK